MLEERNLLTNTILSERLGMPISKIRRDSKEFLPPDLRAKRRSGYKRMIDLNDAFRVYLGGHLVSVLGFSFTEARTILNDIKDWMAEVGLLPVLSEAPLEAERTGIDMDIKSYQVRIIKDKIHDRFYYQVIGVTNYQTEWKEDKLKGNVFGEVRCIKIEQVIYDLTKPESGFNETTEEYQTSKILTLQLLLEDFKKKIFMDKTRNDLKNWEIVMPVSSE